MVKMILIKRLGVNKEDKNSYGIFKCEHCLSESVKRLSNGYRNKSCGCIQRKYSHGETKTSLYKVWASMKQRCLDKNQSNFHRYGGRGISVCEEWSRYEPFMEWALKNGYREGLQIDRKDNDGNYEPSNCRFVSMLENCRNRPQTKLSQDQVISIREIYKSGEATPKDIAKKFGISCGYFYELVSGRRRAV